MSRQKIALDNLMQRIRVRLYEEDCHDIDVSPSKIEEVKHYGESDEANWKLSDNPSVFWRVDCRKALQRVICDLRKDVDVDWEERSHLSKG